MLATFDHLDKITSNIVTLYFKPEKPFTYIAGQYVEVTFPKEQRDTIGGNRWFTLSSSPTEEYLEISTRISNPINDFKNTLINLEKGENIKISEPYGDFVLPIDKSIPLVFVCGGIGITPMRSIAKYLSDKNESRNIKLYYFVKSKDDLAFIEILKSSGIEVIEMITNNKIIDTKIFVKDIIAKSPDAMYFVSGPQKMVEGICKKIDEKLGHGRVTMDYFPGYNSL